MQTWITTGRKEDYFLAHPAGGELGLSEPEKSRRSQTDQYIGAG